MAQFDLSLEAKELPDPLTMGFLHKKATAPREQRLAAIVAERHQQLAQLYFAVKDRPRLADFEAGFGPAQLADGVSSADAMDLDSEDDAGLEAFINKYNTTESLNSLDLSLPPLSPSPPPSDAAEILKAADQTSEKAGDAAMKATVDGSASAEPDMSARTSDTASSINATSAGTTVTSASATASSSAAPATSLPVPTVSITPTASTSALPYGPPPGTAGASTSPAPAPAPSLSPAALIPPPPPLSPVPATRPYTSMFGIPQISSNYVSTMPELPQDVLRSRLNSSVRKKGKEKAAPPPDLYKMHIKAQHTGAKNFLGRGKRVHNVLSTHDWGVGLEELRAVRAFERIEQLKAEKAWSFRQPKKQRVGLVPKAHWDHLMDEMRWLQTDFRQEQRWKVATAYLIACAVRDWHKASPDERKQLCVKSFIPTPDAAAASEAEADVNAAVTVSRNPSSTGMDVDADGSVDAEGDADADADAEGEADDGEAAKTAADEVPVATDVPAQAGPVAAAAAQAVGQTGSRPGTPSRGAGAGGQTDATRAQAAAAAAHIQNLIALRAPVFELGSDATMVDPRALSQVEDDSIALSLSALFPDLPLYSDFLLASDPAMEKRIEDSSAWAGRISHVTKLLESKPLLLSTVQPSKTKTTQGWDPATAAFLDDSKDQADVKETPTPQTASVLFAGLKPRPKESAVDPLSKPAEVSNPDVRAASLHWAPEEDARVLALVKQYGSNWPLIAEIFNGTMTRPPSDHRLAWDIFDRWDKLAGPSSRKILPGGTEVAIPPPEYIPQQDRTGKAPQFANFDGSRKRLRHLTIFDAMRKVQKKREVTASKQPPPGPPRRVNMSMHDSHNLPPRPVFTPMEWHAVKIEQDAQKMRMRAQQQAEFAAQQQRLQAQQAAAMAQQNGQAGAQQQQQVPQQQQPNGMRFQGGPVPQGFPPQQGRNMPLNMQQAAAVVAAQQQRQSGSPNGMASPSGANSPGQFATQVPAQANGPIPTSQGPVQLTPEQMQYVRQQREAAMQAQALAVQAQQQAQAQAQQ